MDAAAKNISKESHKLVCRITKGPVPLVNAAICGVTTREKTIAVEGLGLRNIEDQSLTINTDDQFCLYSCTKSMTAMAALILYERGEINLDVAASTYVPEIDEIGKINRGQVNKDDGSFIYKPVKPANKVTVRHLMLHTAGFSYGFLSRDYFRLAQGRFLTEELLNPTRGFFKTDKMPLLFEPGTDWMYGHNLDWLGLVIESVSGMRLGEFLKKNVFIPAGMSDSGFSIDDDSRLIKIHKRSPKSKTVTLMKLYQVATQPKQDMGGQGGFSTVADYLKFIRIWLNYGTSPDTGAQILKKSTVDYANQNHLPPGMTVDFSKVEGVKAPLWLFTDGFTLTGNAYNRTKLATGRPRGLIYWSGFANLYYWIDFKNGVGGFWAEQLMPFGDLYLVLSYIEFENMVYNYLPEKGRL